MRPLPVVMHRIPGEHTAQVSLAEDQHPVGDLGADGQHEAFGEAVRAGTSRRDLDDLDARVRQDRVERRRELPVGDPGAGSGAEIILKLSSTVPNRAQ